MSAPVRKPFVPPDFSPPRTPEVGGFSLKVLAPDHTVQDYAAVVESADRIRGVFGPDNAWPEPSLSLEENTDDLRRHAQEFDEREAFAYSMWSGADYAGCLYIRPFKSRLEHDRRRGLWDAVIYLWMANRFAQLDELAFAQIRQWLLNGWPFETVVWPGRKLSWADWETLA